MNEGDRQALQLVTDCRLARAAKLRKLIVKGYKLSDLCLVQYHGFPVFHIKHEKNEDGSYLVTCDDKFKVELVKHMSQQQKAEWKMRQAPTGLWITWRGLKKPRSSEI